MKCPEVAGPRLHVLSTSIAHKSVLSIGGFSMTKDNFFLTSS